MATTLWGEVVDALVATMRATSGYRSPTSTSSGITVYDGPEVLLSGEPAGSFLVIGSTKEVSGADYAGRSGQTSATFGNRSRDEAGTIVCQAVAQSGDVDVKAVRDAALAVMGDVEDALRADNGQGVNTGYYCLVEQGDATISQYVTGGAVCEIEFMVTYKARI